MSLYLGCNRVVCLGGALFFICLRVATAETVYFSAQVGADMITVASEVRTQDGTAYVALDEMMDHVQGVVAFQPDRIQANYDGTTVVLSANDTAVRMAGKNFHLVHPVRRKDEKVYISLIDVPVFFSSAFGLPFSRTAQAEPAQPAELTPLDPEESSLDILDETLLPPLEVSENSTDDDNALEELEPDETERDPAYEAEGETASLASEEGEVVDDTAIDVQQEQMFDLSYFSDVDGTIVVDPGHGGLDTGATAGNNMRESDLTLTIAQQITSLLKEQTEIQVILTRDEDVDFPLSNRKAIAEKEKGAFFLSLHAGYSATPRAQGISIFTDEASHVPEETISEKDREQWQQRQKLAEKAGTYAYRMAQALGENSALGDVIARSCPLILQREINLPVVLLEIAYLSNIDTATLLSEEEYQAQVALNLACTIAAVLRKE